MSHEEAQPPWPVGRLCSCFAEGRVGRIGLLEPRQHHRRGRLGNLTGLVQQHVQR